MLLNNEKFIGIFLLGMMILTSCSNTDDSSTDYTIIAPTLDQWWYPKSGGVADFYIHSDGRYEQRNAETNVINSTGNWVLENENLPVIRIDYDEGTNPVSSYWLKFEDI